MKHIGKSFRRTLTLAAVAAMLVGTAAASNITKRTIEVYYPDIKMVIGGQEVALQDAAGNSVSPFLYNNTTYLPIRAVSEALGQEVTVGSEGDTMVIYIGETIHLPYQVNEAELYDGSDPSASFSVAGKNHTRGVVLKSYHTSNGIRESWDAVDGSAVWNTDGYQTMTFTVGHVGDRQENATLYVSLDSISYGEYQLRWDGSPQTITVPLGGSPNVKLTLISEKTDETSSVDSWREALKSRYGVYDVTLK
ncbi:MAG: hypothetical protein HFF52_03115 [Lawsonibacter sp.]|nr:hypothetical protein [Lawsonibacter sp.]